MSTLSSLSDAELVARLPALVQVERHAMADVIEHLIEVERRRLYLAHATSSLYRYCIERLGYAEDAALKRHRVARLALRLPQTLEELRAGTIHLTGLFLLSTHLTEGNAAALLDEARGKSRRQIEELIACWFPRSDVAPTIELLAGPSEGAANPDRVEQRTLPGTSGQAVAAALRATCPGAGGSHERARLEPLSPGRVRVEFTARAELCDKLAQARQLLSHALPGGDLAELFERALDALLEKETRRRFGAGRPRKRRQLKQASRHVPVKVERAVWQRDGAQCTFVDSEGHRCSERNFLTIEHRHPFALGGPSTAENLCLLCRAHNLARAREVFGVERIRANIRARGGATRAGEVAAASAPLEERADPGGQTPGTTAATRTPASLGSAKRALSALCHLGFQRGEAAVAIGRISGSEPGLEFEQLLRKSLTLLVPASAEAGRQVAEAEAAA